MADASAPIGVVVFPVNSNPYQELLHRALEATGEVRIKPIARYPRLGSIHFLLVALGLRVSGYSVVHLHWPAFGLPTWLDPRGRATVLVTRLTLRILRTAGYRVVWTVHNLAPHQTESTDDRAVARAHARAADVQIVHSARSERELRAADLACSDVRVVPHGNYIGQYVASQTRDETRSALGLDPAAFVFLFLGLVRPYKGVPALVEAFLAAALPDARLVVAGQVMDPALDAADARVQILDGYVADADVANLMAAADVVCLPFLQVATSGSALLAMSFGKPVVASRAGDLADLPAAVGWFFEPGDGPGLAAALETAAHTPAEQLARHAASALEEAQGRDWRQIATATLDAYRAGAPDTASEIRR